MKSACVFLWRTPVEHARNLLSTVSCYRNSGQTEVSAHIYRFKYALRIRQAAGLNSSTAASTWTRGPPLHWMQLRFTLGFHHLWWAAGPSGQASMTGGETAAQGIFVKSTTGGTSGKFINYVDSDGQTIFALLPDGSLLLSPLPAPPAGTKAGLTLCNVEGTLGVVDSTGNFISLT